MEQITMTKRDNLSIEDAFHLFLRKCKVKNLSLSTIKGYENHFHVFQKFMDVTKPIAEITTNMVDDFILYLRDTSTVNGITVNSYLRSIRAFLYYCMECNFLQHFSIQMTKVEKKIKETYTEEELQRLLTKPDINSCSFSEFKVWTFESYLLGTGNRISSALNVQIRDINFEDGVILLRKTKNRKQQILPLSNSLAEVLREYLEIRGGEPEEYLFCNNYGQQSSISTFQQLVSRYNIKRNVNKSSCHLFRHTFAKQWILNGGDIFRLQKIFGHSDLSVVKEYVNMFGQDLQLDFEKFNPLDNMKKSRATLHIK